MDYGVLNMQCIDLFAGAGGLSEGFKRAGFNILAHVEMDSSAALTLKTREAYYYLKSCKKIHKYKEYLLGDITRDKLYSYIPKSILDKVICECISDFTIDSIFSRIDYLLSLTSDNEVDVVIGGPPCQAYSIAGRGRSPSKMGNDKRNYLYLQYIKFLKKYHPKMFVFENVVGIFSAKGGKILADMKEKINEIGYELDIEVIDASKIGVIQKRKRVIIRGIRRELHCTFPVFTFPNKKIKYSLYDLWEDLPALEAGGSKNGKTYISKPNKCCKSLRLREYGWNVLTWHNTRPNNDQDLKIYHLCVDAWNKKHKKLKYNELPLELKTHKNHETYLDRFNVLDYEGIAHTLVAHIAKDGHYYIHPDINQNRSISVREAARIQSFPDDYYFEDSRTAAFRQIGNAVPPLLAQYVADDVLKILEGR